MSDSCSPLNMQADRPTTDLPSSCSTTFPSPDAIIAENKTYYRVCFHPDVAGVITTSPHAAPKSALAAAYPELVRAWGTKKAQEREEALRIYRTLKGYLHDHRRHLAGKLVSERNPGVACDQNLLPGMRAHWGELRQCAAHSREDGTFEVCKGCRVAHHAQHDRDFDRSLVMTRGARVRVCESCAKIAVTHLGVDSRACICDRQWTCYRCREGELESLAKARKKAHVGEKCGKCGGNGNLVGDVEVCLLCREMCVYRDLAVAQRQA